MYGLIVGYERLREDARPLVGAYKSGSEWESLCPRVFVGRFVHPSSVQSSPSTHWHTLSFTFPLYSLFPFARCFPFPDRDVQRPWFPSRESDGETTPSSSLTQIHSGSRVTSQSLDSLTTSFRSRSRNVYHPLVPPVLTGLATCSYYTIACLVLNRI